MRYHRLTREERYQIASLKESGHGVRRIARVLGRDASTISRELRRNSYDQTKYFGAHAQKKARRRSRRGQESKLKIKAELKAYIEEKLRLDWSPEQIAGRLMLERKGQVSYSTIYRFIYRDAQSWGKLFKKLRSQRKKRKQRKSGRLLTRKTEKTRINERPLIIEERGRLGDFERDTVRGKGHHPVLLTIVDRRSRRVKLGLLKRNSSMIAHKKTVSLLRRERVKSITNDNGKEFVDYFFTSQELRVPIFFCDPGKSSQRGTNENTNGLLRQYFPKKMDFSTIKEWRLREVASLLNNRPRKCLAYKTPNELHTEQSRSDVALV